MVGWLAAFYPQMCVLMAGMVFVSNGFQAGSFGYSVITWGVAVLLIGSSSMFVMLVTLEVYRSIRYHKLHLAARAAEVDRVERMLRASRGHSRRISDALSRRGSLFENLSEAALRRLGAVRRMSLKRRKSVITTDFSLPDSTKTVATVESGNPADVPSDGRIASVERRRSSVSVALTSILRRVSRSQLVLNRLAGARGRFTSESTPPSHGAVRSGGDVVFAAEGSISDSKSGPQAAVDSPVSSKLDQTAGNAADSAYDQQSQSPTVRNAGLTSTGGTTWSGVSTDLASGNSSAGLVQASIHQNLNTRSSGTGRAEGGQATAIQVAPQRALDRAHIVAMLQRNALSSRYGQSGGGVGSRGDSVPVIRDAFPTRSSTMSSGTSGARAQISSPVDIAALSSYSSQKQRAARMARQPMSGSTTVAATTSGGVGGRGGIVEQKGAGRASEGLKRRKP